MKNVPIRFSLICPTRLRPEKLIRFLTSITNTAENPESIEVMVVYDDDDLETASAIEKYVVERDPAKYDLILKRRKQSHWLNNDYFNFAAKESCGEFIWCTADDVIFRTKGWDRIVYERAKAYQKIHHDGVVLIKTNNNTPLPTKFENPVPFCCFPAFSRQAYTALGFIMPPQIATWGADIAIYRIYLAVNRILDLSGEVLLDHVTYHNGSAPRDEISRDVEMRTKKYGQERTNFERNLVPKHIQRLKEYIG